MPSERLKDAAKFAFHLHFINSGILQRQIQKKNNNKIRMCRNKLNLNLDKLIYVLLNLFYNMKTIHHIVNKGRDREPVTKNGCEKTSAPKCTSQYLLLVFVSEFKISMSFVSMMVLSVNTVVKNGSIAVCSLFWGNSCRDFTGCSQWYFV